MKSGRLTTTEVNKAISNLIYNLLIRVVLS